MAPKEGKDKDKKKAKKSEDTITLDKTPSKSILSKRSTAELTPSDQNVMVVKNVNQGDGPSKVSPRMRRTMERVERLARPPARRLRSLWDEKCAMLPKERRDKIKSALEEEYFLNPEQTEQYFQAMAESSKRWTGPGGMVSRRDHGERSKDLHQRQKWLVNFSAQVAYRMCDYIAKGQKEMLVSNRLRSIADVVLERVAEILGEPKPSRTHPGRLARFMVAISDRIAVWIENAVYRADALEPKESCIGDEHIRLDAEKPLIC